MKYAVIIVFILLILFVGFSQFFKQSKDKESKQATPTPQILDEFGVTAVDKSPMVSSTYHPGGPFYYKWDIKNYKPFHPNGEIVKEDAEKLAQNGYAYIIAYFNDGGQPTKIEKHYRGKISRKSELIYKDGKLIKSVITHSDGKKQIAVYSN